MKSLLCLLAAVPFAAFAGGSNYGITPGAHPILAGKVSELSTGRRSQPRRIALAPDGMLWVTLYGNGKLVKVDPVQMKVIKEYQLPGGNAGPYAVNVDGGGMVWVNEINNDTVVRLNPATGEMQGVPLPSKNVGIRKMAVDASGKLWYMGSHNGRLGLVE